MCSKEKLIESLMGEINLKIKEQLKGKNPSNLSIFFKHNRTWFFVVFFFF